MVEKGMNKGKLLYRTEQKTPIIGKVIRGAQEAP